MPWRECKRMDERLRFVARLLDGEKMARAVPGVRHLPPHRLQDLQPLQGPRARGAASTEAAGPYRQANRLPFQVERTIVALRQEHPTWGAVKIREKLIRDFP